MQLLFNYKTLLFIPFLLLLSYNTISAQSSLIENAKTALKTGSSKALAGYLNEMVELSINGDKSSYSKTQAEFVLKDFFKKYPPTGFDYIHQGSSKEGLKYTIGKYKYSGGSFRVYMLIKQFKGKYLIDTLNFDKE